MTNEEVFKEIVSKTTDYVRKNGLKSLILGISGGIDSTVVSAVGYEVSKELGIPFIGRSLPCNTNQNNEMDTAKLVGNAFCTDFDEISLQSIFDTFGYFIREEEGSECWSDITQGNIKARLRMIYLYHLAGIHNGIVLDTDNLTEHYLGFFTIHGDVADLNPIGDLWKTEVFGLGRWLVSHYHKIGEDEKAKAIDKSLHLTPTDGNGVKQGGDMAQIAPGYTYNEVDYILQNVVFYDFCENELHSPADGWDVIYERMVSLVGKETVERIIERYKKTEFKRKRMPIVIRLDERKDGKEYILSYPLIRDNYDSSNVDGNRINNG